MELLQINGIESKSLNQILSLENLKHLYLYISFEEDEIEPIINLKKLKNLERLNLCDKLDYKGFEFLKELKALRVEYDFQKITPLPKMEKLERLNFSGNGEITLSSKEFPNLKELKIEGDIDITLKLPKLEILECPQININDIGEMPKLKKLWLKNSDKLSEILTKAPNLTHLYIEDLKQTNFYLLKSLQKLKYLDFTENSEPNENITDIKDLNYLPNLKGVNLAGFEKLGSQLNNIEIVAGMLYFFTYIEDDLWI